MKQMNQYLVYGASGTQGGAVADLLIKNGFEVRTITRSKESAKSLKAQGISAYVGDLADAEVLYQAHEGVNRVFLNLPVEFNPDKLRQYTKNAVDSAIKANVKLFVFNTSIYVPNQITNTAGIEIKRELINVVKQSGLPFIIVEPINYMENFLIPGVLNNGVLSYPVPADKPISWISINDAAQYHYYALQRPELAGSIIPAPGLEALTGSQVAQTFSDALGEDIRFITLPFDSFEEGVTPLLGGDTATGLKEVYQWFYDHTDLLPLYEEVDQSIKNNLQLTTMKDWIRQTIK
ncbi:NAD(P)H azoreductase [compost metagenome]